MIFFPNMTMRRYVHENTGTGVYGESVGQYTYTEEILVDFQHENNQEFAKQYGIERQNLYKIYINHDIILEDEDVLVDEYDNQYLIVGEIQDYTHFHNYRRVHLVRSRRDMLCQ